jgi:two-component system chemotaxis response regulator CheB
MSLSAIAPRPSAASKISVMVVDDSAVVRGLISRQIDAEPDMVVTASAANGLMALTELARRDIDVVVLDLEMPVMDGMTALPQLLAAQPGIKVLIASTLSRRNAEISLRALDLGAADYLPKPDGGSLVGAADFNHDLIGKIRALGGRRIPLPPSAITPQPAPVARPSSTHQRPTVIAIGGSTGAPPLLIKLFEQLKGRISQPVLITQHMPPTFTAILAEQIARVSGRKAAEAQDGEPVLADRIYVAPGGWHMTAHKLAGRHVIRLNQEAPENFCRPAVDPMLRSMAEAWGGGVMAVILTGMGCDGAKGCDAVVRAGGRVIVQDEASSAVWGMPGAVAKAGLAERILPINDMAAYLAQAAEITL